MKKLSQPSDKRGFLISAVAGALLGTSLGAALAQDRPPGQLDADCAGRCTANGYDAGFCEQVCWIPDPAMAAMGQAVDWNCFTSCRDQDRRAEDCLTACRRR